MNARSTEPTGEEDWNGEGTENNPTGENAGRNRSKPDQNARSKMAIRPEVLEGYGSWMLVKRKERQPIRGYNARGQSNASQEQAKKGKTTDGLENTHEETIVDTGAKSDMGQHRTNDGTKDKGKRPLVQTQDKSGKTTTRKILSHDKREITKENTKLNTREDENEIQRGEQGRSKSGVQSRKAAAEQEHIVVRGTNGGAEIVRYTVQEEEPPSYYSSLLEETDEIVEHTNDPPNPRFSEESMEEDVFVDLDEENPPLAGCLSTSS
nr:hypothetical protein Iba_chr03bCG4510 [Ipomoea batatas]